MTTATVTHIRPNVTPGMRIDEIRVVDRHRKDLGDIDALTASITDVGLLQPIVVNRDGRLVAGQRRLEACKRLGWIAIPVVYVENPHEAVSLLKAERDENVCRQDMLPSEKAALGETLRTIERPHAAERQGTRNDLQQLSGYLPLKSEDLRPTPGVQTRDVIGASLGMHGRTYDYLRLVFTAATDTSLPEEQRELAKVALDSIDRGGSVQKISKELSRRLRAKHEAEETKREAMADAPEPQARDVQEADDWIPGARDSSPRGTARRRELIRNLAARGWSSHQISDRIGTIAITVRRIAREEGITIPADEALGRNTSKKIDSNRVVRETVTTLEGLELGLDLIVFDDIDPSEVEGWTVSLSNSIRVLNRLNQRLKEMIQ